MTRRALFCCLAVALVACKGSGSRRGGLDYPESPAIEQYDDYHGTRVADPYRWLEDENSARTRAWIEAQNKLTFSYLEDLDGRDRIRERLEELWSFERHGIPRRRGGRLFYSRNDGTQDQAVLWVKDALDSEPRVLLDPNGFSEDGTVALAGYWPSPDGALLAYATSSGGSDWREFRVRDVETGHDLAADTLRWIKFSGAEWTPDGRGFFYARMPAPEPGAELSAVNRDVKVYYHRIGTPQDSDRLVYERPDEPLRGLYPWVTDDGRYLGIWVQPRGTVNNGLFLKPLEGDGEVIEVFGEFDGQYWPIGAEGDTLYVATPRDAPNRRVVAVDVRDPREEAWRVVVPEREFAIEDAFVIGGHVLVHYLRRAHSRLELFDLAGNAVGPIELPGRGSAWFGRDGLGPLAQRDFYFAYSGFARPPTILHYDLDFARLDVFREPDVKFDPADFVTTQVVYISTDGEPVTMFLSWKKREKLVLDGSHRVLLYGYGGFGNAITPWFGVDNLVWMEMGGILAMPNLRGGSEYGERWHKGGRRENKQQVFDDFIRAAERLVENGYTSPERIAIQGASNGGLLVGACMTQRPDLFGACLPEVGVMDMLRFHQFTIGHAWVGEYGSAEDPEMFPVLYAYSPYHNLRPGTEYPATLITTADHDDRVVPAHSFKFAARLQACQAGPEPALIRIETRAGHGAGTPVSKRIDLATDQLAFLAEQLDMKVRRRFWRKEPQP